MNTGTCSICGGPYLHHGNNPDPFPEGRACHDCDNRFVTPARIFGVSDPAILELLTKFAQQGRFFEQFKEAMIKRQQGGVSHDPR